MANPSLGDSQLNGKFEYARGPNGGVQWLSKLCENGTLARSVLAKVRDFITTLERDSSYTQVFKQHAQVIAYIKNDTNANVLSSNCTEYLNGLFNAGKLDQKAEELQEYNGKNANNPLRQLF